MPTYLYFLIVGDKIRRLKLTTEISKEFTYPVYLSQLLQSKKLMNGKEGELQLVEHQIEGIVGEMKANVCELDEKCQLVFNEKLSFLESEERLNFSQIFKFYKKLLHEEKTTSPYMFIFTTDLYPPTENE